MKIVLNGKETETESVTLLQIIRAFRFKPERVVAELNGQIVDKKDYNETRLNDNDKLELVQFVGGG